MWSAYSSNLLWFGLAPFLEAGTPPTHTPWSSLLIKKFTSQYYDISSLRDLGQTNKKGFFVNLVWPSLRMITGVWLKMLWISSIIQDLLSRSNFIFTFIVSFLHIFMAEVFASVETKCLMKYLFALHLFLPFFSPDCKSCPGAVGSVLPNYGWISSK